MVRPRVFMNDTVGREPLGRTSSVALNVGLDSRRSRSRSPSDSDDSARRGHKTSKRKNDASTSNGDSEIKRQANLQTPDFNVNNDSTNQSTCSSARLSLACPKATPLHFIPSVSMKTANFPARTMFATNSVSPSSSILMLATIRHLGQMTTTSSFTNIDFSHVLALSSPTLVDTLDWMITSSNLWKTRIDSTRFSDRNFQSIDANIWFSKDS
ncbi:hypothetical protein PQX77_020332 [Marasmius sp. AFHP31]|nr:hypothetical protein PQX77_020332 [Marasmius sp. AFHP31]